MNIKTVTVVGANGTMGSNISGIFASFGNAKVYLISRNLEKSQEAVLKASQSVKANSIARNLIPMDYSSLEQCVSESDLVFESMAEDLEIKLAITARIGTALKEQAIACSGTSGLSITKLAECFPTNLRGNYFGIHMFNPPYSMLLCEVTPTKYSNPVLLEYVKQYLKKVLYRTVVEVKDSPAFLGNRIGFQFINEALQEAEKYKYSGGIDYIDAILGPFTGRAMAPLNTADFVGLDVHKAIVDNIYANTNDYARNTFILPAYVQKLIDTGSLGRKSKGGLYKTEVLNTGIKQIKVYDIATDSYRDKINYSFPFVETMISSLQIGDYPSAFSALIKTRSVEAEISLNFLLKYIVYSLSASKAVGYDIHSADDVMATGFNWCPPLAMLKAFAVVVDFRTLIKERWDSQILDENEVEQLLAQAEPSKYDYRPYFKSAR